MSKLDKVSVPPEVAEGKTAILANNLTFVYNPKSPFSKKALDGINLTVNRGEFIAIVGQTGSGKTTFVQHLNALIRVQSGELYVLEHGLHNKKLNLKLLRKSVGMVFQYPEYQLFADSVLDDVCFGLKNFGITDKTERDQLAKKAIELVGLDFDKVKNKSPFDLSGGEKRRVALAGVLAMNPQLLVLDEPTAGLDPRGKKEILSIVSKLNREQGVTVIMVSHDMNEVYENADRIVVFLDGKIVYDTTPRELFRKENEIVSMNLEIPHMAKFCNEMERNGYIIPDGCKTVNEVYKAILALSGGGDNA